MEKNFPLVSIITPSLNQGLFIEETILSVLRQDYPNIEYIIIDGGSTDSTLDIIRKYESRIKYWISEPDKGQTDAIIKGFHLANGEFMTWLCSDDVLEPSSVSIQLGFLQHFSNCDLVYGDRTRIDEKGNIIGYSKYPEFRSYLLKMGFSLPQETVMIRSSLLNKIVGLNQRYNMAMDYDLWCQLEKVTEFCHIPRYIGRFRSHKSAKSVIFSSQMISNKFDGVYTQEIITVFRSHYKGFFPQLLYKNLSRILLLLSFLDRRKSIYKKKVFLARNIAGNS